MFTIISLRLAFVSKVNRMGREKFVNGHRNTSYATYITSKNVRSSRVEQESFSVYLFSLPARQAPI